MAGDLKHVSPFALIFLTLSSYFDLLMCGIEQVAIVTHSNVQFGDFSIFKEASDKDKNWFLIRQTSLRGWIF